MLQEDLSNNGRQAPLTLLASSRHRTGTDQYHAEKLWQMRMFFFIVCAALCFIITIGALTASVIVFYQTKNYYSFFLATPCSIDIYFMRKFSKFLLSSDDLPMEENRFQVKLAQIQAGKQKSSKISQIIKSDE